MGTRYSTSAGGMVTEEGIAYFADSNSIYPANPMQVAKMFLHKDDLQYTTPFHMDGDSNNNHVDNLRWFYDQKSLASARSTIEDLYVSGKPMDEIRVRHDGKVLPSWYVETICKRLENPNPQYTNETFKAKLKKKYDILIGIVGTLCGNELTDNDDVIIARIENMKGLLNETPRIELK